MKETKTQYMIDMFNIYSVTLLNTIIPIVKDNRFTGHLMAETDMETGHVVIKYNARRLCKWSHTLILSGIFHEIGHIKQGLAPYETEDEMIALELDAELYCLKMMKKYYPELIEELCNHYRKRFKQSWWKKLYPIHYKAWKHIKEYQ